jgi:hypothetical protein
MSDFTGKNASKNAQHLASTGEISDYDRTNVERPYALARHPRKS